MGNKEEIENRIAWINERAPLTERQISYIKFHMLEQNKELLARVDELEKANEWISVDDRLPEDTDNILVIRSRKDIFFIPEVCQYIDGYFKGDNNDNDYLESSDFVTHWKPLPNPPKTK